MKDDTQGRRKERKKENVYVVTNDITAETLEMIFREELNIVNELNLYLDKLESGNVAFMDFSPLPKGNRKLYKAVKREQFERIRLIAARHGSSRQLIVHQFLSYVFRCAGKKHNCEVAL